jgi:hypothetical protein
MKIIMKIMKERKICGSVINNNNNENNENMWKWY